MEASKYMNIWVNLVSMHKVIVSLCAKWKLSHSRPHLSFWPITVLLNVTWFNHPIKQWLLARVPWQPIAIATNLHVQQPIRTCTENGRINLYGVNRITRNIWWVSQWAQVSTIRWPPITGHVIFISSCVTVSVNLWNSRLFNILGPKHILYLIW